MVQPDDPQADGDADPGEKHIHINSMVAHRDQQPYVTLKLGDQAGQLTPTRAREIAAGLVEAAEAAEADAFIVRFLAHDMDLGTDYAAAVLQQFRKKRGGGWGT